MNGDTSIRPCRIGTNSGTRLLACPNNSPTGSRDPSGRNSACDSNGATARASFPRATRSARLNCSPSPARAPDRRAVRPSAITVMPPSEPQQPDTATSHTTDRARVLVPDKHATPPPAIPQPGMTRALAPR